MWRLGIQPINPYDINDLTWKNMQSHFKFSLVASVGGLILVIIACQLTVFMQNAIVEMHYRETCARSLSESHSSDVAALKKLGLVEGSSVSIFCQHYM